MAHKDLSLVLLQQGRAREAISHCRQALRLRSDWPEVMNTLAWILATHKDAQLRDGAQAVLLAEKACRLVGYNAPILLDTLAASYAEVGRFDQAVKTAQEAIQAAQVTGEKKLVEDIYSRLELYNAKRPHRESFSPETPSSPKAKKE